MSKLHLSADNLAAINRCMDERLKGLETLHWRGAAFGASDPFYRNVQLEVTEIEAARTAVGRAFEAQFPPVKS